MNKYFLRAKHWQLFLLFYLPSFVVFIGLYFYQFSIMMEFVTTNMQMGEEPNLSDLMETFPKLLFRNFIGMGCITVLSLLPILWLKSITLSLYQFIVPSLKFDIKKFIFWSKVQIVIIILFAIAWFAASVFVTKIDTNNALAYFENNSGIVIAYYFAFIFSVMIFSLILMGIKIYSVYIASKVLKAVETKQRFTSDSIITDAVLLYFTFVGLWFVQPRVNELEKRFSDE